jgi:hypothetical protein
VYNSPLTFDAVEPIHFQPAVTVSFHEVSPEFYVTFLFFIFSFFLRHFPPLAPRVSDFALRGFVRSYFLKLWIASCFEIPGIKQNVFVSTYSVARQRA